MRAAGRALAAVAERPRHLVLAALVGGLLAGAWAPGLVLAVAIAGALLARRTPVAALAVAAAVGGGIWADARIAAIGSGAPPGAVGAPVRLDAIPLETVRTRATGERVVRASVPGRGDVLLKAPRGIRFPAEIGAVLEVRGVVVPLSRFDRLQRRRGAVAAVEVAVARPTGARRGGLTGALDTVRRRATAALTTGLPDREGALLRGMVLGQDDAIPERVRTRYEDSSLAHLLAVSGTNVMLLAALALGACALLGVGFHARLVVALVLIAAYVPLTGAGASIQRAGVMGAAGLVAVLAGRPSDRWYAIGLAAAVTLALNPYAAADPGWQLSFLAVLGLMLLTPLMRTALVARGLPAVVADVAAMTAAATIATAPLLAAHFGRASLVGLPANLAAAPVVAPLMWLGMAAAAVGQLHPSVALPLNVVNAHLVAFVDWVAATAAALPYAAVDVPEPGPLALAAAYAAIAAAFAAVGPGRAALTSLVQRVVPAPETPGPSLLVPSLMLAAAAIAAVGLVTTRGGPPPLVAGETRVAFLDVGQGDATLVRAGTASVLFDTGPPGGPVVDRVVAEGVRRLDALVITHAQSDHEGAAIEVVRRLRPRLIVDAGAGWPTRVQSELPAAAGAVRAKVWVPWAGRTLRLGPLELRFLWPSRAVIASPPEGDPNGRALVTHVRAGDFDLLLPADAESPVTAPLSLPRAEALKVAHHGSADEGLPDLLRRVAPRIAAIEVGRGNSYGHPAPSTLAALARAVPHVHRTDRDGTVRLRVVAGEMTIERAGVRR